MTSLGTTLTLGFGGLAVWDEGFTRSGVRTRVLGLRVTTKALRHQVLGRHITKDRCKQLHCQ